jgi:hypothetical protein
MELTTRFANYGSFLEIKVDEIQTDIFKDNNQPLKMIENLISVIEDLCKLTDKEFNYEIKDLE